MNDEGHNYYDKQQHGAEKYEEECNWWDFFLSLFIYYYF